ncbi:MAG: exopolyphosphatase [Sulfuricella sp.]|nr:exopolyphosphatase [Sulfuricella sp.]
MREYSTVAAVDLGSNSFRLQVARVVDDQIYPLDSLKDTVRLGAGLGADKTLDQDTCDRALASLGRFGERLRGLPRDAVRAVGTNTFRVAKNAQEFLQQAEAALGFPIEIIAGREEARLIYLGVSHSLPASSDKRLVVDIGGGSTEFIIGTGLKPQQMESLYMGCVSYSQRYFPDGKISKGALRQADLAARAEVQAIAGEFSADHWQQAIGSSGTAKALSEILQMNGYSDNGITPEGLAKLRDAMLKAGDCSKLQLAGLRPDRVPVLGGGFAIMAAIFAELDIACMGVADSALREGVLYDLLGRFHRHDMRETTVRQFMRRYHVDPVQAGHVGQLGIDLLRQLAGAQPLDLETVLQRLSWAALLHEIGLSIAHSGFHKHSAYIIEHADMPGFSKKEQAQLSRLVLAQRGSLNKAAQLLPDNEAWAQILALRLAVLFYRSRIDFELPEIRLGWHGSSFELTLSKDWLNRNPLTETALENEAREWKSAGVPLGISALP